MVSCLALLHVAIVAEMRLVRISAPLSALLEVDKLSRPQVVKQLWVYIKANDLQNPGNKREIICDDRLRPVFNADKIDMFKMNKELGQCVFPQRLCVRVLFSKFDTSGRHLYEAPEASAAS